MPQFYNWVAIQNVAFYKWGTPGAVTQNSQISIKFYKFGTPGAVTQTVEFLSNFTNLAPLEPLHKLSNFYRILQIGHPWGRYTNRQNFIEFYKLGNPGAVTQTVEILSNFTNWAPLGPLHKLPNFYRIFKRGTTGAVPQTVKFLSRFKMGYPCGRHTNCPIFTTGPVTLTVLIHSWVCCTNRCSSRLAPF